MKKIQICKVNLDYVKYLHCVDNRVQYNENRGDDYNRNRPYVGVVLNIKGKCYFAPLEHPRPQHTKLKNNVHIFKIEGGKYGIIGLNNMIPVPLSEIICFDINTDKNRKVLLAQYIFCQKNATTLFYRARQVYERRMNPNSFEKKIYCDFAKLEEAAERYSHRESLLTD